MEIRLQMVAFEGEKWWLVHRTGDASDSYWSGPAGLLRFESSTLAESFVRAKGHEALPERLPFLELDDIRRFARQPRACVCPDAFYNCWNFFADLASTVGQPFSGYSEAGILLHEELFWSSSLTGQVSPPRLEPPDLRLLRKVVKEGLLRLEGVWEQAEIPA